MKAVVQRALRAELKVDGRVISKIGNGLVVFLGVGQNDEKAEATKLMEKISKLRIFEDENGKMNLSVKDVGGEVLLVSQFTLYADCKGGNRPSFVMAEKPERANALYLFVRDELSALQVPVKTGVFGADMKIEVLNDGPVTIVLDAKEI